MVVKSSVANGFHSSAFLTAAQKTMQNVFNDPHAISSMWARTIDLYTFTVPFVWTVKQRLTYAPSKGPNRKTLQIRVIGQCSLIEPRWEPVHPGQNVIAWIFILLTSLFESFKQIGDSQLWT